MQLPRFGDPVSMLVDIGANILGLDPAVAQVAKMAIGGATGNYLMVASGAGNLVADLVAKHAGPTTEYRPSKVRTSGAGQVSSGYAPSAAPSAAKDAKAQLEALRTLRKEFDKAEVAGSFLKNRDGLLGVGDLRAIIEDNKAGADIKRAAQFVLDHPALYRSIAQTMQQGPGGARIGFISQSDMDRAVEDAQAAAQTRSTPRPGRRPETTGEPRRPGTSGVAEPRSEIQEILNDRTRSTEDKLRAILWEVMGNVDDELLAVAGELDDVTEQRKALTSEDDDKDVDLKRSMEKLSDRFQELVQKRRAMFELLTNMTMKQGEMALRAMSNLGQ